ncbi:hypothetical protein Cgig2_004996 [Carnegiea gigantea]|uniref:mRNA export factor GLE1 n=1 Tax=Carnegiea gigantea TaxID=171969 RepID=A0A9Q1KZA6_9CARY|nr:hypothetical protein Cgig2_004996 [Carnegiea gigantea]
MKVSVDLPPNYAFSCDLSIGNMMLVNEGFRETGTIIAGLTFQLQTSSSGVAEGELLEQTHQHQLHIKAEIRNQLSSLETQIVIQDEKFASTVLQIAKNAEARREMDRKLNMQYQHKIQHILMSYSPSGLGWRSLDMRQAKSEASEMAERERKVAEEAERVAKEAAFKMAEENSARSAAIAQAGTIGQRKGSAAIFRGMQLLPSASNLPKDVEGANKIPVLFLPGLYISQQATNGNYRQISQSCRKWSQAREEKASELQRIRGQKSVNYLWFYKDFSSKEREIARCIKQISGTMAAVRSKATELVRIFNDPAYSQTVTVSVLAKKVISIYDTPNANFNGSSFACGHVVYISAQIPIVMDGLLAEFHRACIYTVPKHIVYSESAFETKAAYFKSLGYGFEGRKLESTSENLNRLESCMKLFGALVQTEAQGITNIYGLEQGWVWLARLLNNLPADVYTAVALEAFLSMAGYALYRRYKSQFQKILRSIAQEFVKGLRGCRDPRIKSVITRLENYMEANAYLMEPAGWQQRDSLLSSDLVP